MEIRILLAGEEIGPFTANQVRQYMGEGLVAPSDLAISDGMEDWQSVELLLASLPASGPASGTVSPGDSSAAPGQAPELPLPTTNDASPSLEMTSARPPTNSLLTATKKTKRKLNKIVIQPILPLETTGPLTKRPRTEKTALTIEPPRPTTSLPPVTASLPSERKTGRTLLRPVQLSLGDRPERPAAPLAVTPPPAPLAPPEAVEEVPPAPAPPEIAAEAPAAKRGRFSREFTYVASGLACVVLLVAGLAVLIVWLLFTTVGVTVPAGNHVATKNAAAAPAAPAPATVETPKPESVPHTAADYTARGLSRQGKGDLDGAIADYSRALELDPKNLQACYQRGLARQAQNNWNGALADFNAILSLNPQNAGAFSNRGFVKQAMGDPDGALADYNQALLINPKIPVAYYNVGLIKVQKGDLDGAIAAYNQAVDLDPKMAIAYYNRGVVKNTEGNLDGAIADYTQALNLNPTIARAFCDRGSARQSKGDLDGALGDYAQALALNPKMPVAYFNRGLIKMQRGDLDGALIDNTQAIELDPKNGQAYCNRGMARLGTGNLDGAMDDLIKFGQLAPRDGEADATRLYLWVIATEKNPKGTADQDLATALLNNWNSPPEDFTSKIASFLLGHISENALIANAASPDPSREPGQYCRGWYFAGMKRLLAGDMANAIVDFQKSVATGQKDYCEYIFARVELQALGQVHDTTPRPAVSPR